MIPFSHYMPYWEFPEVVGCWNMWLKFQAFLKWPYTSRYQNIPDLVSWITVKWQPNKYPSSIQSFLFLINYKINDSKFPDEKREEQCLFSLLEETPWLKRGILKATGLPLHKAFMVPVWFSSYTLNRIPKEEWQWRNLRLKIGTWTQPDILELGKASRSLEQLEQSWKMPYSLENF